ncbi:MAG: RNA-directed DNA polymerase [Nitrospirales bacterium]
MRTRSRHTSTKVLVSCDIADFYDRLNLHRLESILLSLPIDKTRVRQLNELLLFWANRDSYGIPVGSNASRILAEAALLEVDNYLLSMGIKFCRFVDDYRLFAPNAHTAHYWLTQLIERLWIEGLTINKSKTKIEDVRKLLAEGTTTRQGGRPPGGQASGRQKLSMTPEPQFRIVAGYGGIIPTRFREPKSDELNRLQRVNSSNLLKKLKAKEILPPEDVLYYAKVIVSQGKFRAFSHFPELAEIFPQVTPYLIDILIKYSKDTPVSIRSKIQQNFAVRLKTTPPLPEYILMAVVHLLGTEGYKEKNALLDYFRALRRNAGAYIGLGLLDSLESQLSRGEVLEIRRYFQRADQWEKRQIVRIVNIHLSESEKRPWLKNIRNQESQDIFLEEYIKPSR